MSISFSWLPLWFIGSILVYLIIRFIHWLYEKYDQQQCFRLLGIPGPKPSFWWGNYPELCLEGLKHMNIDRWSQKYGKVFGFFQGTRPILVIADAEIAQELLVKNGRHFPNRLKPLVPAEPFLSSLLDQRDKQWRKARRVLTPPFTAHKVSMQTTKSIINIAVKSMLNAIDKKWSSGQTEVNMTHHVSAVTLDVISRLAFNMNYEDIHEESSVMIRMVREFMDLNTDTTNKLGSYFPILQQLFGILYRFSGGGIFLKTIIAQLNKCINEHFQEKIEKKLVKFDQQQGKNDMNPRMNLLDYMFEQQELGNLNENQIIGNAVVILLAGYETTATGLAFTLYLLAKHQDIQNKLRKELMELYDDDQSENYCQFDQNRCELLERVWTESLRLYPPVVTFITRELAENEREIYIEKYNLIINQNMTIMVPTWTVHHDPKYWKDPLKFDPYRQDLPISSNNSESIDKNPAFMPFGLGPRNCIGGNLANSEARAVLAAIVSKYKVDLVPETSKNHCPTDPETGLLKLSCPTVIIHPTKELWFRLTPVDNKNSM